MNLLVQTENIEAARQFITREFASVISGKNPQAYLRRHDKVQNEFVLQIERRADDKPFQIVADRAVHLLRELSLFGLPRTGRGFDECCAFALESGFELARADESWRRSFEEEGEIVENDLGPLDALVVCWPQHEATHAGLREAIADIHARRRERGEIPQHEEFVIVGIERWFRAGAAAACYSGEVAALRQLVGVLGELSAASWRDYRLHAAIIRNAARVSPTEPKASLLAHPLFRLSAYKHRNHPAELEIAAEFLHAQCIQWSFESEEDQFASDLALASWVRAARNFGERLRREQPARLKPVFRQAGRKALQEERAFLRKITGPNPGEFHSLDLAHFLIRWRRNVRGTRYSSTRGEVFEAIVHCVHTALWVGWLWPTSRRD